MKRWYFQLAIFLLIGLVLGAVTFDIIRELRGFGHSEALQALSLSGIGLGVSFSAVFVFIVVLTFDAAWSLLFIIWLIKKILHIKNDDNTIYLP